jgi:ATP/maltotriose-dependent transcriptional regulator MalT
MQNEDKRVGKNPAGYLVASIRADYEAPGDFPASESEAGVKAAGEAKQAAAEAKRRDQGRAREESEQARAREADLRAVWDRLPEAERQEILAAVKAENPGLSRWTKMLEPLCLAALEARNGTPKAAQKSLFE